MEEKTSCGCNLFDFMANTVGINVLHPGGYKATNQLCSMLKMDEGSRVLDVACGKGTTTFYLAKRYGCPVTGFDISAELIATANRSLGKYNRAGQIIFDVADALDMPYADQSFDVVISQAFFILMDEKQKALKEIIRVLKPGGYLGSLELGWFKKPPRLVYDELVEKACTGIIPKVIGFQEWESFFASEKLTPVAMETHPMPAMPWSMLDMFGTEGLANSLKIMRKMMGDAAVRNRMMTLQSTFSKYNDYIGYGIFGYRK
jgi:ubiquinone/menaquinone biosynthesis C-methylase UbiE